MTKSDSRSGRVRAYFHARIPGFGAIVNSAAEMRDIPAWVQSMRLAADWDLLYLHTPARIRVGTPRAPWLEAGPGTAVLLAPFSRFWIDTRPGKGHHSWINIEGLEVTPAGRLPATRHGMPCFIDPTGALGTLMTGLVDTVVELQDQSFWALQLVGNRIISLLESATPARDGFLRIEARAADPVDPLVARVMAYLSANLSGRVTLESIAHALHTSPSTISHRYRAATGETALATHRRMRLLEVKRLLAIGQPLAAIAAQVGYCDVHHLSREFKRQEGMTPRGFVSRFLPRPDATAGIEP